MFPAALQAVLEYGHILSAVGWLGAGMFTAFVLGPLTQQLPPPTALALNAKLIPKLLRYVTMMVASTLLFGILLLYVYVGGDFSTLSTNVEGMELMGGVALALVTAAVAFLVTIPSFNKVAKIAAELVQSGGAPPAEFKGYAKRAKTGALIGVFLLFAVVAFMVAAGY